MVLIVIISNGKAITLPPHMEALRGLEQDVLIIINKGNNYKQHQKYYS
jgi:hypothetical protein